jgi:uncharacterized protein YneF (UPF0154 family)
MSQPNQNAMYLGIGLGVVGGLLMGRIVVREAFQEGLTDKERKGVLVFAGGLVGWYAIGKLLDLDERWYDMSKLIENPPIDAAVDLLPK